MKEPNLKKTLISGIISLILCASMLIGTTFSWFTDSVSTPDNIIATGTLDIELEYLNNKGDWKIVDENTNISLKSNIIILKKNVIKANVKLWNMIYIM